MTIFSNKLMTLPSTVRMGVDGPIEAAVSALRDGAHRPAVAIGSGGAAVMAEYFARCRSTLSLGLTVVMTPMEFVVAQSDWASFDIWLFSASANNPDVAGALTTALASSATNVRLLTVNREGATALTAAKHGGVQVMVAPVAEPKDGFLATHSLVAMITCMLAACDEVATPSSGLKTVARFAQEVERLLIVGISTVDAFRSGDTVVILHDPQCRTLGTLIETSLWETGIAPTQRTDFRNFAHGRHVWAAKHPHSMFILAIKTSITRDIWKGIRDALPATVRMAEIDLVHAGRLKTAISVIDGLLTISSLGDLTSIDPGKPGSGEFAGEIYGDTGLAELAEKLDPAVRHKLDAVHLHDDPSCSPTAVDEARSQWLRAVSSARIGALVLDYDGTVVTTEARLSPPSDDVVSELTRLADSGIALAFATGRGGSAGEALRAALPKRLHDRVVVGYYNGGHLRPLSIDIDNDPPAVNPDLAALANWIEERALLKPGVYLKRGRVQITVNHADVEIPSMFLSSLITFPAIADGRIKRISSHHSFDLLPSETSKISVLNELGRVLPDGSQILAIGDSGEPGGNDHELLSVPPSISVDCVCGQVDGSWSLFGKSASGPTALLRILRAIRVENGHARLDLDSFGASQN